MTPQQIKAYDSLPEDQKEVYSSVAAARLNKDLLAVLNIEDEKAGDFIDKRGDFVLGILSEFDFTTLLQKTFELDKKQISLVLQKTEAHWDSLRNSSVTDKRAQPAETEPVEQLKEIPPEPTPVQPMHTMSDDIEKIHGYGAVATTEEKEEAGETEKTDPEPTYKTAQESVLDRPKVADIPTYNPTEDSTKRKPAEPETPADTRWNST